MGQLDWLEDLALGQPHRTALTGQESLTYSQLSTYSAGVGRRMRASGIAAGDRIAILSESRPLWGVALFASWRTNATVVPLDDRLEEGELLALVRDARPRAIIASARCREVALRLAAAIPDCRFACLDHPGDAWFPGLAEGPPAPIEPAPATEVPGHPDTSQPALLVYTSGTAGQPKGVVLSHANLDFQVKAFPLLFDIGPETVAVSILPLNHVFELTVGLLGVLHVGGRVCYCGSLLPDEIGATLRREHPTTMVVVPLFLGMLKARIERGVLAASPWQRATFALALRVAQWLPGSRWRRAVFRRIHDDLGGRLEFFIVGGAPLAREVERFFVALGLSVYQGYGLTENAPVVATNAPGATRAGSVGRPLPGLEVRCTGTDSQDGRDAGDIRVRGASVMAGYFGRPELSTAAIDADGWLRTGDTGHLDADGYLYVTGRHDDLIVLGNGKKVLPAEVEAKLHGEAAFKEVAVVGGIARHGVHAGNAEVCAVVVPADALTQRYRDDPDALHREALDAVRRCARDIAIYKRPTRVVLHPGDLPKTTTRKLKRGSIRAWLAELDGSDATAGN